MKITVHYQLGPVSGTRTVEAPDDEAALRLVKAEIHRTTPLPMSRATFYVVGRVVEACGEQHGQKRGADGRCLNCGEY